MHGQVNTGLCIVRAEHVKGVPQIINLFFAVPSPAGSRIREMPFTGAAGDAVLRGLGSLWKGKYHLNVSMFFHMIFDQTGGVVKGFLFFMCFYLHEIIIF